MKQVDSFNVKNKQTNKHKTKKSYEIRITEKDNGSNLINSHIQRTV